MALVFVCDAPSAFRDSLEKALIASGHRVNCVSDTTALFAQLRGPNGDVRAPDCAYIDEAAAGGPSGLYAAAVRLRGGDRGGALQPIATLAVVARPEPEVRATALQVMDDVVSRPPHLVEVLARIEALLRRPPNLQLGNLDKPLEDTASGLRTRAFLDERIIEEWRRSSRFTEPLALLIVGLGGDSGQAPLLDRALRDIGGALRRSLRQIDVLARFGATEVAALLVNTHLAGALTCAERLRREVSQLMGVSRLEVVMGLALFPGKDVTSGQELVRVAERALNLARSEGAGSICLIQHQGYLFEGR